jgi:hypothetical protein
LANKPLYVFETGGTTGVPKSRIAVEDFRIDYSLFSETLPEEHLEAYKQHCIDQAITILNAGHDVKCMFGTPKLIEALSLSLEERGSNLSESGITGIFSGGTEFTPQWTRFCVEESCSAAHLNKVAST